MTSQLLFFEEMMRKLFLFFKLHIKKYEDWVESSAKYNIHDDYGRYDTSAATILSGMRIL